MKVVNKTIDDRLRPKRYHELRIGGYRFVDWHGRLAGEILGPHIAFLHNPADKFLDFNLVNNIYRAVDKGIRDEKHIRTNRT